MKIEDLVKHNLSRLNDTDLIVWRYIYAHLDACCYISIYDLAEEYLEKKRFSYDHTTLRTNMCGY
jgi:hypothetical protein